MRFLTLLLLLLAGCQAGAPIAAPTAIGPSAIATAEPTATLAPVSAMPTLPPSSPTPAPTATATPKPPAVSSSNPSTFDELMKPFAEQVRARRGGERVNILLFGYGETYEPSPANPDPYPAVIGSVSILSYHAGRKEMNVVSLTHDIRAPEIERYLAARGSANPPVMRIDRAYELGGIALLRQVVESATGLPVDYALVFRDALIRRAVDDLFGSIEVEVSESFEVHGFYLDGKKYPGARFPAGKQKLNGIQVVQFIKTVPVTPGYYGKELEHNARKHLVFRALLSEMSRRCNDKLFWIRAAGFAALELGSKSFAVDLGPDLVGSLPAHLRNIAGRVEDGCGGLGGDSFRIGKTLYIVDPCCGDGGVRWVAGDALENSVSAEDLKKGAYPSPDFEVPVNGNPYATDLRTEYWQSVRDLVAKFLE